MLADDPRTITLADLESLRDNCVTESKTLEYKRQPFSDPSFDRATFLATVCALANTDGGDILFGVETKDGVPVSFPGIPAASEDDSKLRVSNALRDMMEPRLAGLIFWRVALTPSTVILGLRVAPSVNAPHRSRHTNHFYRRGDGQNYALDVPELRDTFLVAHSINERIRAFHAQRLGRIFDKQGPELLALGAQVVLHVIPLSAFKARQQIDIDPNRRELWELEPMGSLGSSHRVNLDGYVRYYRDGERAAAYSILFRNGIIEAVKVFVPQPRGANIPEQLIPSSSLGEDLRVAVKRYFGVLKACGIDPPAVLFLSLLGVHDYVFAVAKTWGPFHRADRSNIALPEVIVDSFDADPDRLLKPILDVLWNAFGLERCTLYDENGIWRR
jgi:hypothetical protein